MSICFTGDIPTVALIEFNSDAKPLDGLRWVDEKALWCGCIDAPDVIPAGSSKFATSIGCAFPVSSFRAD